jgi:hypothetical protein
MSPTTRLNWLAAIIIAMLLASANLLDGPSEIDAAQDMAADVSDAIQTAKGTQIASTHRTQVAQVVQP